MRIASITPISAKSLKRKFSWRLTAAIPLPRQPLVDGGGDNGPATELHQIGNPVPPVQIGGGGAFGGFGAPLKGVETKNA